MTLETSQLLAKQSFAGNPLTHFVNVSALFLKMV